LGLETPCEPALGSNEHLRTLKIKKIKTKKQKTKRRSRRRRRRKHLTAFD
jgi:hypothetical protein